jgi:hypothetical protein
MTNKHTPSFRFEVSLEDRLKQRDNANNAVRMPRLGFKQYCVYDIEPKAEYKTQYTFPPAGTPRGTQVTSLPSGSVPLVGPQVLNVFSSGRSSGKSKFAINQLYGLSGYALTQSILDTLSYPPRSKVKWLKPKHVTMLKLKGHRVEEL